MTDHEFTVSQIDHMINLALNEARDVKLTHAQRHALRHAASRRPRIVIVEDVRDSDPYLQGWWKGEDGLTNAYSIGFSGTQRGMKIRQRLALLKELERTFESGLAVNMFFHHGDCIGADAAAHVIAVNIGYLVVIHPPDDSSKRAFCRGYALPSKPYLDRNRDIASSDRLIAVPKEYEKRVRSGTWSTVRYARNLHRPVTIIYPDGRTETDDNGDAGLFR
jgi:hypothetical protein